MGDRMYNKQKKQIDIPNNVTIGQGSHLAGTALGLLVPYMLQVGVCGRLLCDIAQ